MFIVAGLGNPGLLYRDTRHNAGYLALDRLAGELHIRVTKRGFSGVYGEGIRSGERILLIKPETFMNLSGECVAKVVRYYKAAPAQLVVLCDDVDLPPGALRIRQNGGAGTHNGMRSIIACLGSEDFARIRIGVGDRERGALKDYVLGKPSKEEREILESAYADAAEAAQMILDGRIAEAQTRFNKRRIGGKPQA